MSDLLGENLLDGIMDSEVRVFVLVFLFCFSDYVCLFELVFVLMESEIKGFSGISMKSFRPFV